MPMKMCEECGTQPATIQVTQIMQDQTRVAYLCPACAGKKGITIQISTEGEHAAEQAESQKDRRIVCSECGHTLADFKEKGWLGCSGCYHAFEKDIQALLVQMHGSAIHKGKKYRDEPVFCAKGSGNDLKALRRELDRAITREEFERAAQLRDAIAQISDTAS